MPIQRSDACDTPVFLPIPAEERQKIGLTDSLIRLSVGVESFDDLRDDLDRALENAG